jgi:hypothetical protein
MDPWFRFYFDVPNSTTFYRCAIQINTRPEADFDRSLNRKGVEVTLCGPATVSYGTTPPSESTNPLLPGNPLPTGATAG